MFPRENLDILGITEYSEHNSLPFGTKGFCQDNFFEILTNVYRYCSLHTYTHNFLKDNVMFSSLSIGLLVYSYANKTL